MKKRYVVKRAYLVRLGSVSRLTKGGIKGPVEAGLQPRDF